MILHESITATLLYKYNIASKDILKLQCVQNYLAKVVTQSPRFSSSVQLLKPLHWLPVQSRIIFKICTITYQTLSSGETSYIFYMFSLAPKPRELRSSGFHLLSVAKVKTQTGTRTFQLLSLLFGIHPLNTSHKSSNSIVSFRQHLKTHLFRLAYPS